MPHTKTLLLATLFVCSFSFVAQAEEAPLFGSVATPACARQPASPKRCRILKAKFVKVKIPAGLHAVLEKQVRIICEHPNTNERQALVVHPLTRICTGDDEIQYDASTLLFRQGGMMRYVDDAPTKSAKAFIPRGSRLAFQVFIDR